MMAIYVGVVTGRGMEPLHCVGRNRRASLFLPEKLNLE